MVCITEENVIDRLSSIIQYDYAPTENSTYNFYDGKSISIKTIDGFSLNEFIIYELLSLPEKLNNIDFENEIFFKDENYTYVYPKHQTAFLVVNINNKSNCISNKLNAFKIKNLHKVNL